MGFLKKLTKPISKVLDKIVPNEIKPALPFLAAATPFLLPGGFGIGSLNPMISRAIASGAANLGAQLAQEGSEGDFSGASLALAAGIGALSAPGAGDTLRGGNVLDEFGTAGDVYGGTAIKTPTGFIGKGKEFLATGADKLQGIMAAGKADPFSMAGLKAASIPITQGTMDLGIAEARRTAKDLADEALNSLPEGATDADRALAIRQFMEAAGYFSEDEIVDTIEASGYADGGRVGFDNGGGVITEKEQKLIDLADYFMERGMSESEAYEAAAKQLYAYGGRVKLSKGGDPDFSGIKGAVISVDENMRADRAGDFFRLREEAIMKGDDDKIKEIESDFFKEFGFVMPKMAKDGGRINLREGGVLGQILPRPSIADFQPFLGQPLMAAGRMPVFPRLNQLEQEVNRAEGTLNRIRNRLGEEQRTLAGLASFQPGIGLQQPINMNSLLRSPISALQQVANRDANQMEAYKDGGVTKLKEGGMMDLGGKEMDLRKGGFVPIGKKERADDVPARLSKNEFVMTADAVRGAGGGDINKGAKRMYETMNRLEARA